MNFWTFRILFISVAIGITNGVSSERNPSTTQVLCEENTEKNQVYWNSTIQKCVLKVGFRDSLSNDDFKVLISLNTSLVCPNNSYASGTIGDQIPFMCSCNSDYVPTIDWKICEIAKKWEEGCLIYNSSRLEIYADDTCHSYLGFRCNPKSNRCECKDNTKYNPSKGRCFGLEFCSSTNKYEYDPVENICVIPLNSPYSFGNLERLTNYKCPENAEFEFYDNIGGESDVRCICKDKFELSFDKSSCIVPLQFNSSCDISADKCSENMDLQCTNGTCQCKGENNWEIREKACRVKNSGNCQAEYGYSGRSKSRYRICGKHSTCINEACNCDSGYHSNNVMSNFCYGGENSSCEENSDCESNLKCIDGRCQCPDMLGQKYESNGFISECRSLFGSYCDKSSMCGSGGICRRSQCACDSGYTPTKERKCMKTIGQNCSANQCNPDAGLACIDGLCKCIGRSLHFHHSSCVAPVGHPCFFESGKDETQKSYFVNCEFPCICKATVAASGKLVHLCERK